MEGFKPDIIRGINQLLHESNHYVEVFKVAKPSGEHSRRYSRPLSDEIVVLMPNDAKTYVYSTVFICYKDDGLKHISELHRSYDPLHFSHMVGMST